MTSMDEKETPTAGDDSLPFGVRVMILLIILALLGVVVIDILHFAGAL